MPYRDKTLSGLKVLFVSATDYSNRTREFREATSLYEAGADVHVIGYAEAVPDIWRNSKIKVHEYSPKLRPSFSSQSKIRFIRIATNLTINIARRAFYKNVVTKRDYQNFVYEASRIKPDVVHAMDLPSLKEAALIAQKCGSKLVYDSSEYWQGFLLNKVWESSKSYKEELLLVERKYIKKASLVLTTSKIMSSRLKADYSLCGAVECLYNAPICQGQYPTPAPVHGNLKIVFHGNIGPDRNLQGLLEALALVSENITLDVYGNFILGMQEVCESIVEKNQLQNRVVFHGGFVYGTMLDFLPKYDVGFYPAHATDGNFDVTLPNKVFDYICSGLAVVVPKFASLVDLVNEIENGLIVDTSSVEAMAASLAQLNDNFELVNEFKKNSCDVVSKYSWESQGEKLVAAYEKIYVGMNRAE